MVTVPVEAVAPVTWPKVSNVKARSWINVLPELFWLKLPTLEVSWCEIVMLLSVPFNTPAMSIPGPSRRSILSPGNTSSTFVSFTLISKDGFVAWYLVSKSAVVIALTWPSAVSVSDLMYWPSCVFVWPKSPAVPVNTSACESAIVSVFSVAKALTTLSSVNVSVSLLESATTVTPPATTFLNMFCDEPLSVFV